jgi:hypothetical protein
MMPIKTIKYLACLPLLILMQYCNQPQDQIDKEEYYTMEDFPKVVKYDTHIHINTPDPFFVKFAIRNHFRLLSLNVGPSDYPPIEQQQEFAVKYLKEFPGDFAYATTFHIEGFGDSDWQQKTLDYLKTSFGKGAIGVKVWKNIGMEFKDREGRFVMIDNPRFDTIFNFIEHNNKTVVGHLGEPKNCWLPLEKMTVKNDQEYYKRHPEYHMFLHPEFPSYEDQINARDNMLKKHPDLRFDGAHLGSLEWSVDELAKHLDSFPKMAVDMAARISHLEYQAQKDHQKVYDFFIKYQDRLLYATDMEIAEGVDTAATMKDAYDVWINNWKFFTSDEAMEAPEVEGKFKALHLPKEVIDKIYRKNAEKWFPGFNLN